jgi:membrane-associated phospholipid phosphatase
MILALYPVYGWIRDLVGVSRADAFHNAKQIIDWQQRLGIFHERTIQGLLPSSFGFVDTRLTYFTIGKPVPHAQETGDLYSAMPSLHIAWATWAVFALWPLVRPYWARTLLASYPVLMIFATVVTGNHYFLDAVGGWVVLAAAYTLARWRDWWPWRRVARTPEPSAMISP